jgi:hypothetical protein
MHIKKNIFENIFNTIMNMKGKANDNMKAIMDIPLFCYRKNMKLIYDGSQVAMSKLSPLHLRQECIITLFTNDLRVHVFLMDMLQTYLD